MKFKIHKPTDKSSKTNERIDREREEMELLGKKYSPVDDFDFEMELIAILTDLRYKSFSLNADINGTGVGFFMGVIFSLLMYMLFILLKVKL